MQAMIAARSNVERKLDELTASYRTLRQEEITAEIVELSAGTLASTDSVARERPQVEALSHDCSEARRGTIPICVHLRCSAQRCQSAGQRPGRSVMHGRHV